MRTYDQLRHVPVRDMTKDEVRMIVHRSCQRLQDELNANRTEIVRILDGVLGEVPE